MWHDLFRGSLKVPSFDTIAVCARFQPPQRPHLEAVEWSLSQTRRVIVVCFGSNESRSLSNPWSNGEREAMIRAGLGPDATVEFVMLEDRRYDPAGWSRRAASIVGERAGAAKEVYVVADRSPGFDRLPLPITWTVIEYDCAFADDESAFREHLFWRGDDGAFEGLLSLLPIALARNLHGYARSEACRGLREEATFISAFRQNWVGVPYPPVFVTVDILVVWRAEVLLIQRGRPPGKGLWALPGGFIEQGETLACAAVRELREETGLALEESAAREHRVFDAPGRSLRGRTITHVFRFEIDASEAPPAVAGGDDACRACWTPLHELGAGSMFEDHYAILQVMLDLD